MNEEKELFEKVYEEPNAVWTREEPPEELIGLIESGQIKPCKVLDVGCGEGFYSIYLAKKGFEVVGIDFSENAIRLAKQNAEKVGVDVKFIVMDLVDLPELKEKFDFVLEWAILHCISFDKWKKHIENVSKLLNGNGKYLSTCFNVKDAKFGEPGERIRTVPENIRAASGSKLYFSTLDEVKELLNPYFNIIESKILEKRREENIHTWNYFFVEKK